MDDLEALALACRDYLERARAYRADLRAQHGDRDDCHDLAAGCRFYELDVLGLRVVYKLGRVGGAARLKAGGKVRGKVAPVHRRADEHRRGRILVHELNIEVGVCLGAVAGIALACRDDDAVGAAAAQLFQLGLRQLARTHGDELISGLVAELSYLAAQLKRNGVYLLSVMLDVYPHIPVIALIHSLHLLSPSLSQAAWPRSLPRCPRRL